MKWPSCCCSGVCVCACLCARARARACLRMRDRYETTCWFCSILTFPLCPPSQDLKPGNLAVNEDCELKVKGHSRSPTDGEVDGILGEVGFVPRNPSPQPARFPVSLEP